MTGIYKVWSAVPSKEEEATGAAAMQLILDVVPYDDALVGKLLVGLGHTKPTPQVGVLKALVEASERLGAEFAVPVATDGLIKTLTKLLKGGTGVVRDAVPPALTALYRFNPELVMEIVSLPAFKLTRAESESLNKMFSAADEEGEVVGRRTRAYEASLQIQEGGGDGSNGNGASPSSSFSSLHDSNGSIGSASSSGTMSRSSSVPNLAAGVKAVNFGSDEELKKDLANMATQFGKLGPNAWEERVTLLKRFQGLCVGGACKSQRVMLDALVPAYITVFKGLLPMPRAQISDETTKSLSVLAQLGGSAFASFFEKIIKIILEKVHSTNAILVDQADNCILNILRFATPNIGALLADRAATSQHVSTRAHCVLYVQHLISEGSDHYVEKWCDAFFNAIKACVADSHESVRANARRTFATFNKRWPDRGPRLWDSLDSSAKTTMKKEGYGLNLDDLPKDSIIGSHSRNNSHSSGLKLHGSASSIPMPSSSASDDSPLKLPDISTSLTLPVSAYASSAPSSTHPQNNSTSSYGGATRGVNASVSTPAHGTGMTAKRTVSTGNTSSTLASRTITAKTVAAQGGASRVLNSQAPPSGPSSTAANKAVRVAKTSSSALDPSFSGSTAVQQTPRKQVSVNALDSGRKSVGPPSSITKANSAGGFPPARTLTANKPDPSHTPSSSISPSKKDSEVVLEPAFEAPTYTKESPDTSDYRNILKRCAVTDLEERTRAMDELREMFYSDSLPTLWAMPETVKGLCTALSPRLLDSQRILQASLDIVWLMRHERPQSLEQNLEILAPSLFIVSNSVIAKKSQHNTALAILNYLASVEPNKFMTSALKAIENVDAKLKLSTIKCLVFVFTHSSESMMGYFEKNTKRIETFIKWIAIKPHAISSSVDSTRAVTECFGIMFAHLGETFAAHLRPIKFTGQDTVLKKLKISLTAPKVAPSTSSAIKRTSAAPSATTKKTSSTSTLTSKTSATIKSSGPISSATTSSTPAPAPISQKTVSKDDLSNQGASKPRPVLVRQKSLTILPSDSRARLVMSLEEANAEHAKNMLAAQEADGDAENGERPKFVPSLPPATPSADRVREMRMEIAQTPNVLATVMAQPTIISPLTPSLRHGTPSFGARGRSTSTPQMKSFKMSGREVDLQASGIESDAAIVAASPFSPVKFKLDSADDSSSTSHDHSSSSAPTGGENGSHRKLPNNATVLLPLIQTIESNLENKKWEETRTVLQEMATTIANISADVLLVSIHEELLLGTLQCCLNRTIPLALVRQSACKLLTNIKHKLPAHDWDPLFATFPANQQKLIVKFMEMASNR